MVQSILAFCLATAVQSSNYADPGGAFAIQVPAGYKATRQQASEGVYITEILKGEAGENAQISVLSYSTGQTIEPSNAATINKQTMDFVKQIIEADSTITRDSRSTVTFNGKPALRSEIGFKDEEGVTWKGWLIATCGKTNALAMLACAKTSDAQGYTLVDTHANTFAVESRTPFAAGGGSKSSGGGSILSADKLKSLSTKIKGNMKREANDKVLVQGEPPLTYGSVATFVTFIEIIFEMQLTEAEFEATRERFIEYYKLGDAAGKKVLAQQGASMLQSVTAGSKAEIAKNKQESKAIFSNAFERGAEAGIGYAQVMWDAVQRRQQKVTTAKSKPKQDSWDSDVSQADIEATLEMLYFMWVASGRDPNDVTQADIAKVRQGIIQEFATFDPQVQLVIANAQKMYAAIRQQWQAATPQQRAVMARQFANSLDSLGLKEGGGFEQSGGGGGGGSDLAAIAQNTAWNAAKTWSTTSN